MKENNTIKEVAEIRHQAKMGNNFAFKNYSNRFPQFPDAYRVLLAEEVMQHSGKHVLALIFLLA